MTSPGRGAGPFARGSPFGGASRRLGWSRSSTLLSREADRSASTSRKGLHPTPNSPAEARRVVAGLERAGVEFLIPPDIRFAGQPGEQAIMFFADPSGNVLEFKAFRDVAQQLFAR